MNENEVAEMLKNHEKRLQCLEGKKEILQKEKKQGNYKEGSIPYLVCELKDKYGFFDNSAIKTTGEIIDMLKIKFDRKVTANNAIGYFVRLVKDNILDRAKIEPTQKKPRGEYIWFLPGISKEKIENYKKGF